MKQKNNIIQKISYTTFVPTYVAKSNIPNAGCGLFSKTYLKPFTWIGFYPGNVTTKISTNENKMYIMSTSNNQHYIEADCSIKSGVHMVNEASSNTVANVWYIKLDNNYCLYFTGLSVQPNEELLTCYSKTYGKRAYPISNNCSDPRCFNKNHRTNSILLNDWKYKLIKNMPKYLHTMF